MSTDAEELPGQPTLIECWRALAYSSVGARLVRSPLAIAAVFPEWAPLNNAIVLDTREHARAAAAELSELYTGSRVDAWALWIPSHATSLDAPDDGLQVDGLERDTTTLVMQSTFTTPRRRHERVVPASIATVARLDDEPIPVSDLGEPEAAPGLAGWAILDEKEDVAVACGWSYIHGRDCGVYAVETLPDWRRRGLARALVEHMLAEAASRGASTASLQSTRMGQGLYESLGFGAVGRYEEWVSR